VCNFASSILITMLCIMTDLELQLFNSDSFLGGNTQHLQTHFILEEASGSIVNTFMIKSHR
ncbi:MAG: hypothetical protein Q8J73_11985, partial [Methylotenera sp.]|nr:hypothetical protein [Methylotenera sp.]